MDQRIGHDTPGYCMSPSNIFLFFSLLVFLVLFTPHFVSSLADKQKMHVVVGVLPCSEVGNETAIGRLSKIRDLLTSSPEAYGIFPFSFCVTIFL